MKIIVPNLSANQVQPYILKPLLDPASLIDPNAPDDKKKDFSIFSTALRVVILNIPGAIGIGPNLVSKVLPFLIKRINEEYSVDDMDALISLIERFGSSFTNKNVSTTESCLITLLQTQTGIIQKRSIIALGNLSRYLQTDVYAKLLEYIISTLKSSIVPIPNTTTKTTILLSNTIAKSDVSKFKPYLAEIVPLLISSFCLDKVDDEDSIENTDLAEIREAAFIHIENIVSDFGPHAINPYIEDFVQVSKTFLRYDPNFVLDDEVSEEDSLFSGSTDVEMDDEDQASDEDNDSDNDSEGESDFEEEEAFSDDDDQSWKLRRLSAKLISGLVTTSPMSLAYLYNETLRPIIVSCVKEREDSVKVISLEAFCALVEAASSEKYYYATRQNYGHKRKSSDVSMNITADPQAMLEECMPVVVKNFLKILINKRDKSSSGIKHGILSALRSLNDVVRLPASDLGSILSAVSEISANGSPYMSDILQLVNSVLFYNSTSHLLNLFQKIIDIIVAGIKEQYYRISGEALDTTMALFPHYNRVASIPNADTASLQAALKAKVIGHSFDIDIRKKAILALATLVQSISLSASETESAIDAICGQLGNELLRVEIFVAIRTIISAPSFNSVPANISHISSKWAIDTQASVLSFVGYSNNTVSTESLLDLRALSRFLSDRIVGNQIDASDISLFNDFFVSFMKQFQTDAELYVRSISGDASASRSQVSGYRARLSLEIQLIAECFESLQSVSSDIITSAASISKLVFSTYKDPAASTDPAAGKTIESALLAFFDKYTRSLSSEDVGTFYQNLVSSVKSSLTSAVAGLTIVNCGLDSEIEKYISVIKTAVQTEVSKIEVDSTIQALQIIGFVGRNKALDVLGVSLEPVYELLSLESSETNYIAVTSSETIGKATIGGLKGYLPELMEKLMSQEDAVNKKHLYLTSLRSVVIFFQNEAEKHKIEKTCNSKPLSEEYLDYVNTIWSCLLKLPFQDDKTESGEKTLVAECLGRLSTIDPETLLTELKSQLASPEVSVRRSVISAIRYVLGQPTDAQYDRLLRQVVVDFLVLLEDSNISIRQVALSTLMTAIRNKPTLLLPHLSRLLPLLYKETYKIPELTRIVQMGPFKHEVDDGLELRKLAYEAMFHIVTSLPHEWQINLIRDETFANRIFAGLSDDHDIRVLSCVTLGRMVMVDIRFLTFRSGLEEVNGNGSDDVTGNAAGDDEGPPKNLNVLISKFSTILNVTVNDNAVKQEFEKQSELVRNVVRVCNVIQEAVSLAVDALNASTSGSVEAATAALSGLQRLAQRASSNAAGLLSTTTVNPTAAGNNGSAAGSNNREFGDAVSSKGFSPGAGTSSPSPFASSSSGPVALSSGSGVREAVRASVCLSDVDIATWNAFYKQIKGRSA